MKQARPGGNPAPTNDFQPEVTASTGERQRESFLDSDLEPVGSILARVVETLCEEPAPWDYERCECHRPSWTFVCYLIERARADERSRIDFEEFLEMLEAGQRWRVEQAHGRRRLLRVS